MGCCCVSAQVEPGDGDGAEGEKTSGQKFKTGGSRDLSNGPVKERSCTNPEWCVLFVVHIAIFWVFMFMAIGGGDAWKLVAPRDYKGQSCASDEQWNNGDKLKKFEKALYTLNMSNAIDPIAGAFVCSSAVKDLMTAANPEYTAGYAAACSSSSSSSGTVDSQLNDAESSIGNFFTDPTSILSGTNFLSKLTENMHPVCVTKCDPSSSGGRSFLYRPEGDRPYYGLWMNLTTKFCGGSSSSSVCTSVNDKFSFTALPTGVCPYADQSKCVLMKGLKFKELTSGYCQPEIDSAVLSAVSGALKGYLDGLAKSEVANSISGGIDAAVGDIQTTYVVFILVCVISFVCGLVYLVLLRFLVKPVVWLSILIVFLVFVVGGALAFAYSGMCADGEWTDTAEKYQDQVISGNTTSDSCSGHYQIESKTSRDILLAAAIIIWCLGLLYGCIICCLFRKIRLAIAINEVAALFVVHTPHIVLVPLIQTVISLIWCGVYLFLAALLLSQVPDSWVPTKSFATWNDVMGEKGACNDPSPAGFGWKDGYSTDCINNGKCWKCAPPRYMVDYRFFFSLFSFLWQSAWFVACGQCVIAGAVGIWFFTPTDKKGTQGGVGTAVKNTFIYHPGSLAMGSFILAVVQTVKYIMHYIAKKAEKENKLCACLAKILECCVCCFEMCIKFLNKNAYIQVALMGTPFCTSAREAFNLIIRNAARFGVMGSLGSVIRFIGKLFVIATTAILGFLILQAMEPDISTPIVLVIMYCIIGYFVGSLFMNVFGLAVDSILQCFIATEEMGIDKEFIPERLRNLVSETEQASKD